MSIRIKGMEMPKEGSWVALRVFPDGQCVLHSWCGNDDEIKFDFMEHLTAATVPPHGRLIDADKLKSYWEPDHSRYFDADYFIHTIDVAQTIIPASESEERPVFLPQYELTPRSEEG